MLGGIYLCRLFHGPMVKPQDNVAVVFKLRAGHRHRFIGVVGKNSQGASRIKSNASNAVDSNAVLVQDALDGVADASPDVIGRLLLQS